MLATKMSFSHPLTINLRRQTRFLLSKIPSESPYATAITQAPSPAALLGILSQLLYLPALTLTVAKTFRPLLLDLCARWLQDDENIENKLVALSLLLEPHEELYPVLSAFLRKFYQATSPLAFVLSTDSIESIEPSRLHRLLLAYYRILRANRPLPSDLCWQVHILSHLFRSRHIDTGVNLLAIRCYALQTGMSDAQKEKVEKEVLGEPLAGVDCPVGYGENVDGTKMVEDGWLIPVLEVTRITDARDELVAEPYDFYSFEEGDPGPTLSSADLCPLIADIHGYFFLKSPGLSSPPSLISTPTTVQALRGISSCLSLRVPILLTSPPSSGKSLLISYLASVLYPNTSNKIVTIHLADKSIDPRGLLGSYVSSPTQPGTFEWKDGVIVRAMREGKWLIFEDIDKASNEVLGVIKPLVESMGLDKWIGGRASLDVSNRGLVEACEEFAIFATRSVMPSKTGTFPSAVFYAAHKFHEVTVPSPAPGELRTIMVSKFPKLAGLLMDALIRLWESMRGLGFAASSREIGLRELEKLCIRIDHLLPSSYQPADVDIDMESDSENLVPLSAIFPNPTLREEIYLELRDVFFGTGASTPSARSHSTRLAAIAADHLGLESERSVWLLNGRTPEYAVEKDVNDNITAVRVGRTRLLARSNKMEIVPPPTKPFAMHKPAVVLLSRIATAVSLAEPILLTGETGTGKTSIVTHLASLLRRPLISLNLSHQTESSDLLGGFKPVDARVPGSALQERFLELFGATFSRRKNVKFEESVRKAVSENRWKRVVSLWKESAKLAKDRIQAKESKVDYGQEEDPETPRKRRKVESALDVSMAQWNDFEKDVDEFQVQHIQGHGKFAFNFIEGPLVRALRGGDWILLDEINLASPETLECISGLLRGPTSSVTLTEQGSLEPVPRHPEFRLFACMNPATDVGKKDLPPNIRSRFTEIDVPPPDADQETLLSIVTQYIGSNSVGDKAAIMDIAEFYAAVKKLVEGRSIADGSNHRPNFSMRTLARALMFAADLASTYGLRRALWEGCLMAFTMVLDSPSTQTVTSLAHKHILGTRNPRSFLSKEPNPPRSRPVDDFVKFGPFYLERGPLPAEAVDDYVMTPSVETKLVDLARIIVTRRFPVLIEGPTSSGKTSSIEYLARRTGHQFIRINNHEHTDIQEYLGSYVSDATTGKLAFKDGLLVRALRNGHWIVLDELNLAPTDVLEALNRLLDDNRELVIPETQEVVRPHPHFMLFATQNPPGLYAGRKVLSRAFRNRFLEVHFEDVPQAELETILCQKCRIAPSYGQKIVTVFRELQHRRQSGRVFESRQGFATLRDLFRWAGRDAVGYQELAENGYMLLAERTRREDDKIVVKEVIESVMKVHLDDRAIYSNDSPAFQSPAFLGFPFPSSSPIVWTMAMRRLFILVSRAFRFNEPVLLVGETGSGKTSVCQVYADAMNKKLLGLNCHQNTETADLIGGMRPIRNCVASEAEVLRQSSVALDGVSKKADITGTRQCLLAVDAALNSDLEHDRRSLLEECRRKLLRLDSIFEWHDGPLVEAMRNGDVFLLDEISLADDSVLERLNSVLEPARILVLAERGGDDLVQPVVQAADDFKLVATMNPGGDYGKKELSPALRNRFTEIWVPPVDDRLDLELIVYSLWTHEVCKSFTKPLLDFVEWLCERVGDRSLRSLRDILAWVTFTNATYQPEIEQMSLPEIFHHGAHMTFLDGLETLPQLSSFSLESVHCVKEDADIKLKELFPITLHHDQYAYIPAFDPAHLVQLGSFAIPKGPEDRVLQQFNIDAPTTRDNAMRVVRACQVPKPILLEGSPGVGKTSLITALANITGHRLCRINLSDQTDLIDLFGSDLPVEGGGPGEFAWKDAEFLKALQEGHWVLLDEMNLAPQMVLEGLNAILDHRGTVYIPELGRLFTRHPAFRVFAAQNPLQQGGGRKGLPKSFINRFTKVYVEELSTNDMILVSRHLFPDCDQDVLRLMIDYNLRLRDEVAFKNSFAKSGNPWEFNLRDIIRWGTLVRHVSPSQHPAAFLRSAYLHRFRTREDRDYAQRLFDNIFLHSPRSHHQSVPHVSLSPEHVQIGHLNLPRGNESRPSRPNRILQIQQSALESAGLCVAQSWLAIITGSHNSGKTDLVRSLAGITGNHLWEISMNSTTDAMDILGSFEQVDDRVRVLQVAERVLRLADNTFRNSSLSGVPQTHDYFTLRNTVRKQSGPYSRSSILHSASNILHELGRLFRDIDPEHQELQTSVDELVKLPITVGRFEWVDGPLVRALRSGQWLLLDGANMCSPSVLDRLNSLCEAGGMLTLSERGYVNGNIQTIKPHPNFRLFMTVNPQYGELSRAMRNRGMEIALVGPAEEEDENRLRVQFRIPSRYRLAGDWAPLSTSFDQVRRGLVGYQTDGPDATRRWPSGEFADLDCPSLSLMDIGSILANSTNSVNDQQGTNNLILFLSNVVPPTYALYCQRYFSRLDITSSSQFSQIREVLQNVSEYQALPMLVRIKEVYGTSWGVPPGFISAQPMNIHLKCTPCSECEAVKVKCSAHRMTAQILRLLVDLILDETAAKSSARSTRTTTTENDRSRRESNFVLHRACKAIDDILKTIPSCTMSLLQHLGDTISLEKHGDLDLGIRLVSYCYFLRKATMNNSFDYSTALAASNWISESVKGSGPVFLPLQDPAQRLVDAISLSTGLGMSELWMSFSFRGAYATALTDLLSMEKEVCGINGDQSKLRAQVFQLMSLRTICEPRAGDESGTLIDLGNKIRRQLVTLTPTDATAPIRPRIDNVSLIAELSQLIKLRPYEVASVPKVALDNLQEIITVACESPGASFLRLISYQHFIWALDANKEHIHILTECQSQWLTAIWSLSSQFMDTLGPSVLLYPAMTSETMSKCDWNGHSLSSLKDYNADLCRHVRLALIQFDSISRFEKLSTLLLKAVLMLSAAFKNSYDEEDLRAIVQIDTQLHSLAPYPTQELLGLLLKSKNDSFCRSVTSLLLPAVQHFTGESVDENLWMRDVVGLGRCWIALSRVVIDLFVPDTPVDPAAVDLCTLDLLRKEESTLEAQIQYHRQYELRNTGNTTSSMMVYLQSKLDAIRSSLNRISSSSNVPARPDVSRLHAFWSEIFQFQTQVISVPKVDSLLALFDAGDESAFMREQVVQDSIAGFCHRIITTYSDFDDIRKPLHLALLYLRLGLRLYAHSALERRRGTSGTARHVPAALVAFPSARSTETLAKLPLITGSSDIPLFQRVLLCVASIALEKYVGAEISGHSTALEAAYEQAFRLWAIDRAKEDQRDLESQSLYRRKTLEHDASTDYEIEEKEFLELFPNFDDAASEVGSHRDDNSGLVQSAHSQTFVKIHHALMESTGSGMPLVQQIYDNSRSSALKEMLMSHAPVLHDGLDVEGLVFQCALLRHRLSTLHTTRTRKESYNFYLDSNVCEVTKAIIAVTSLKTRLQELILEWPDQMVLKELEITCNSILGLDLGSSIAKVLSAIERLLLQSQDWEIYANRDNTLKIHQKALTDLIVEWRRLELSCWQGLLEAQAMRFADGACESWFQLYDLVVRGPLAAADEEMTGRPGALTEYFNQFIPLLDDFVRSSPLGQYQPRMRLLKSFETFAEYLAVVKDSRSSDTLRRVQNLLHSTIRFYELFSPQIAGLLSEQRVALEKEIQSYIKLASWKDVNVHALKKSAQRTHHNLYKVIRKFREVMRQPITLHLQPTIAGDAESQTITTSGPVSIVLHGQSYFPPTTIALASPAHLQNLKHTYSRFESLITSRIYHSIDRHSASAIDGFAVEIIVTTKALGSETVPQGVNREKQQKALLVRKRKALSDLLKELKRAGLSSNLRPDILRQQSDPVWIREQPDLPTKRDRSITTEKIDMYFDRIAALLPDLRTALSDHHSDVMTRDLRRALIFLESGFSIALSARSSLAKYLRVFERLKHLSVRLSQYFGSTRVVSFKSPTLENITGLKTVACKLVQSLLEVIRAIQVLDELQQSTPNKLISALQTMVEEVSSSRDGLTRLRSAIESHSSYTLLEGEHSLLLDVRDQFTRVLSNFDQWSQELPGLQHILQPVKTWLAAQDTSFTSPYTPEETVNTVDNANSVIDALLVTVQVILQRCPVNDSEDTSDTEDHYIRNGSRFLEDLTKILGVDTIISKIIAFFPLLAASSYPELQTSIGRILPFLNQYLALVERQLDAHAHWTRSLFKLGFILCSVMHTLAKQGFCMPPEQNDSTTGGDTTESAGGVGLGEGSGAVNVSKEIEDESQVEGLQGEEKDPNGSRDDTGGDDAIEVSEDIGGELEDILDDGSGEEDNKEEDKDSQADLEEQLGDLDASDPSAVDEKLWGDESGQDNNKENLGNVDQDHSEEKTESSDVAAKNDKKPNSKESKPSEENEKNLNSQEDEMGQLEDTDKDDENDPQIDGAPMVDLIQDTNILDLPDDMDLGIEEDADDIEPGDLSDVSNGDDGGTDESNPMDMEVNENQTQQQSGEDDVVPEPEGDRSDSTTVAEPDVSSGGGGQVNDSQIGDTKESATNIEDRGTRGESEGDSEQNEIDEIARPEGTTQGPKDESTKRQMQQSHDSQPTQGERDGTGQAQEDFKLANNPMRSLGDAMAEIRQRFDEILNPSSEKDETPDLPNELRPAEASQIEYAHPDEVDQEMQALGPAENEFDAAKLNDLKLVGDNADPSRLMDVDSPDVHEDQERQQTQDPFFQAEPTAQDFKHSHEDAVTQRDIEREKENGPQPSLELTGSKIDIEMEDTTNDDKIVEAALRQWQSEGQPTIGAEAIWRLYESLTHDLAYALCEQLRLILEPTLATRLKGDYRTGKRLNMKKIISYIASDYTKDKIWLRRTRPSTREYQVLIALDDSRSMAESHSVHLAYEAMALVSKALGRLEVGDIAIAKFGEAVEILRGFDEGPFTDQAGTKVMSAFHFDQNATNVLSLVETSLGVLERARERRGLSSSTAGDLWQLEIIISDGICQDHEKLRTVLRKAEEQRVMIVFVIIDSLRSSAVSHNSIPASHSTQDNSILAMNNVAYKNVDGRMELQMERYLDSFPFEYYVVLRNVEALPEVLTGTLKQFFERISEE